MPAPSYIAERKYSNRVAPPPGPLVGDDYAVETPETTFQLEVYDLFLTGEAHVQHEEYGLALDAFEQLQLLILNRVHPVMPVDPRVITGLELDFDPELVGILAQQASRMLQATPPVKHDFPPLLTADASALPVGMQRQLKRVTDRGLIVTSYHDDVLATLDLAADAAVQERWDVALDHYATALKLAPEDEPLVRGVLLYDMAVLADKADQHDRAVALGTDSLELLEFGGSVDAQVIALDTMVGVYTRGAEAQLAAQSVAQAGELRAAHNLAPIVVAGGSSLAARFGAIATEPVTAARAVRRTSVPPAAGTPGAPEGNSTPAIATTSTDAGALLIASEFIGAEAPAKSFVLQNVHDRVELKLDDGEGTLALLELIATTRDLAVVTQFAASSVQMVAYGPHMYFFVIPMAIGDCLAGLGSLEEAEQTYRDTLPYPYINLSYEAVALWTKLADAYLAMGDRAYRAARDDVSAFAEARAHYEQIVRADGTLDLGSALYADATFADMRTRVQAVLAAADPASVNENPDVVTRVLSARMKLGQIAAGLNFFALGPDYLAPFGWEYLQSTARYFAQSASQIEQRYVQFKTTAESEELHGEQLTQQADVAAQAVVLEDRGLAEAQAGVDVAQASLDYAVSQVAAAIEARDEFEEVRWVLLQLELAETLAANATAPNPALAAALGQQSGVISHDMEAARLERAVEAAEAAKDIAAEQLAQAKARIPVAKQRIAIAQAQQTYAEENRDYLDIREFSSRLWFDLAAQAEAINRRYLDMAIEIALLTERAYNAETERGLQLIRYDYTDAGVGDLLGADRLLLDIDSFTADDLSTVKSKKLPVKKVISLAGAYPTAFQQLRTRGLCRFPTEFADFDREHPGLYLCKLRNVELVLVGITTAATVAGSLRNVGVSNFRREDGSIVARSYPADVMPLSQYSVRGDSLLFRFNPNDLRAFELNGIDALWQLELPPGANRFDIGDILDAQLVLYYDGYFSPSLEASVKAALPTTGAAASTISLAMELPDELFYLKSNGEAEITFSAAMFAANQTDRRRTDVVLRLTGEAATVGNLTLHLISNEHGEQLTLQSSATGDVDATALEPLRGEPVLDRWTVRITAEDNPALVRDGQLDLGGLRDLMVFLEFTFDYR